MCIFIKFTLNVAQGSGENRTSRDFADVKQLLKYKAIPRHIRF